MGDSKLDDLKELLGNSGVDNSRSLINSLRNSIANFEGNISIMISGEFNAGKSTFINALLGEKVLTTDVTPATATITKLTYGKERKILAHYMNNSIIEYETTWTEQLTAERKGLGENIRVQLAYVEYQLPIEILKKYTLIDSPGLGTLHEHHTKVTENFIKKVDIGVWLFNSLSVGTASEIAWLRKFKALDLPIYGIVNAMDRIDEDELDSFMEDNKRRLSPYINKLYGISAIDILNGKLNHNNEEISWGNNQAVEELFLEFNSNHLFKMKSLYRNLTAPLEELVNLLQDKKKHYNLTGNVLQLKKLDSYYSEFEYHKTSVHRLQLQTDNIFKEWREFVNASRVESHFIKEILHKIGNSDDLLMIWEQKIEKKYKKYIKKHDILSEEYKDLLLCSENIERKWGNIRTPILRFFSKIYFIPAVGIHNKDIRKWNARSAFLDMFNKKFRKMCKEFNEEIEERIELEFSAIKSEWSQISLEREVFHKDFIEEYKNIETYKIENFYMHYGNVQKIYRSLVDITKTDNADLKNMNSYKANELYIREINSLYKEIDYQSFVGKLLEMRTTNLENQFSRFTSLETPILKIPDDFSNQEVPEMNLNAMKIEKDLRPTDNGSKEQEPLSLKSDVKFLASLVLILLLLIFIVNNFVFTEKDLNTSFNANAIGSDDRHQEIPTSISREEQEEEIKDFLQSYRLAYQQALNEEDFFYVTEYLSNSSQAYNEMMNAIESIKGKELVYTFLPTEIAEIELIEDDRFIVRTKEAYSLYNNNDGSESLYEKSKEYTLLLALDGSISIEEIKENIYKDETVSLLSIPDVEEMVNNFYSDLVFAINEGGFSTIEKYYVKDSDYYNFMKTSFLEESFEEVLDMNNDSLKILSIKVYDHNHYVAVINTEDSYLYKSMKGTTIESQIEFLIEVTSNKDLKIVKVLNEEVLSQTEF